VKSSTTRTFEASHLWEYIDGDADKYIQAGMVKTLTSDYKFAEDLRFRIGGREPAARAWRRQPLRQGQLDVSPGTVLCSARRV
jgi:hypothetical protein